MCAPGKDTKNLVSKLNGTLLTVSDWLKANDLSVNLTHYMEWHPRSFAIDRSSSRELNGQQSEEVSEKNLWCHP